MTKEPVDKQGEALAQRECAWYEKAKDKGISGIPKIYETSPLKMEFVRGKNIYECDFAYEDKRRILEKLVQTLRSLHESEIVPADSFSIKEAYFNKTIKRLSKIEDLVPFTDELSKDLAPLRMLVGLSVEEVADLLGVSAGMYRQFESGNREVSWDQYMTILFLYHYNMRTTDIVNNLGLYPDSLREKIKIGDV